MTWVEVVGNLHMHTVHSDGSGTHDDLLAAAGASGLDWIIVTDHNVRPDIAEGRRESAGRRVLMLLGQEVHDPARRPQANHLLCLGIRADVASCAPRPQTLIDEVNRQGGAAFLAHPVEKGTRLVNETLPWVDWDIEGFAGIELWNVMSEVKSHTTSLPRTLLLAFFPHWFLRGPFAETLALWDRLLYTRAVPVYAVGGADAHANTYRLGPLRRVLYPYATLFRMVNTHALLRAPFTGDADADRGSLVEALRNGRCWVGYDGLAATRGVRFVAQQAGTVYAMGAAVSLADGSVHLEFAVPEPADLRLLCNGQVVAQTHAKALAYDAKTPGFYRAEAWRRRWGARRGWVFTNPIHLR